MFDLTGKTALVTGATGAIGEAIAPEEEPRVVDEALDTEPTLAADVVQTKRSVEDAVRRLEETSRERVHVLPCDLGNAEQVEALVPKAEETMQKLDVLVANAGVNKDNLFVQLKDEDWDKVIAVNLTATFRLTRAAVTRMMRRRWGRIIGISSVVGYTGNPGQGNYTASKAGMVGMLKSVAAEYARRNVTANCIAPGIITSAMTDKLNEK